MICDIVYNNKIYDTKKIKLDIIIGNWTILTDIRRAWYTQYAILFDNMMCDTPALLLRSLSPRGVYRFVWLSVWGREPELQEPCQTPGTLMRMPSSRASALKSWTSWSMSCRRWTLRYGEVWVWLNLPGVRPLIWNLQVHESSRFSFLRVGEWFFNYMRRSFLQWGHLWLDLLQSDQKDKEWLMLVRTNQIKIKNWLQALHF